MLPYSDLNIMRLSGIYTINEDVQMAFDWIQKMLFNVK